MSDNQYQLERKLEEIRLSLLPLLDLLQRHGCAEKVEVRDAGDGGRAIRTVTLRRSDVLDAFNLPER